MILLFPNYDTLRLCLTSNTVPSDVTLKGAQVSFDAHGNIYLEPSVELGAATRKLLDRLGVKGSKRHGSATVEKVASWLQVLPVTKEPGAPNISAQAPVLFELDSANELSQLVTEMLRLGNDRQSFRWIAAPGSPEGKRVLLRVIGPPYYTLLRALDKVPAAGGVRAYLERAPRVWVEIGYTHPYASQIRLTNDQLVLIREPREWLFLDDAPFQDVYEILKFELPATPVEWIATETPKSLIVPLHLAAGNAVDAPELWVIREDAVPQLDRFVRDADQRLTQRLMFAVARNEKGEPTVVLRTRPSKLPPPQLALEHALGFKPFWKLPNLYLPAGRRLHPTLRRDAVRKLLAQDPDQVVWLYPNGPSGFTPESVPDSAFRPLEDWVDYVIELERTPLAAWIDATRFDFDHFICKDTGPRPKPPDKGEREPRTIPEQEPAAVKAFSPSGRGSRSKGGTKSSNPSDPVRPAEEIRNVSEWKQKLDELEKRFLSIEGGLDTIERKTLWPQLARANTGSGSQAEAAICWLNALWDQQTPPTDWLDAWVRSELGQPAESLTAAEFDRRLNAEKLSPTDVRAVVASFLWLAHQKPVSGWLTSRLSAVQQFIEGHTQDLPVRALWLAGVWLERLSGSDILGLARVRDRLLHRLLMQGLTIERDIPKFLRYTGLKDSDRLRVVSENSTALYEIVRTWAAESPVSLPYIDLLFAYSFGKLGEVSEARKLLNDARTVLDVEIPATLVPNGSGTDAILVKSLAGKHLFRLFQYRVEQAISGQPLAGPLPKELKAELDGIAQAGEKLAQEWAKPTNRLSSINPYMMADYLIRRMREQSRILEPQERIAPYAAFTVQGSALHKQLADLDSIRDSARLADRVRKLYNDGVRDSALSETRLAVLHHALPLATSVGESFTLELLNLVPATLSAIKITGKEHVDAPKHQAELLERSISLAAHYDKQETVQHLVDQFLALVHQRLERGSAGRRDEAPPVFGLINAVVSQCTRSMRKFGLRDDLGRMFSRLHAEALQGQSLAELRKAYSSTPSAWSTVLQTLLNLAGGALASGLHDQAEPVLDEARNQLLLQGPSIYAAPDYTNLARAYIRAIGLGPTEPGLQRMRQLFQNMPGKRITNTSTFAQHYSRLHLNLVEDVILAVASEEFALGPAGRRWLDDDEYLVRKRIHADMKRERERHGL